MSTKEERGIGTVVFSLADGTVWASWPDKSGAVELGPLEAVTYMMQDFLDQCELGERLTPQRASR